ncbi:MAG TPA: cytochrome c-type biogenesis protein CcmH [Acidobacteriota bacterium]|nr:cytochrome c-type biogenesis protein CcmH [Acidobacteriota bacterium]
MLRLKKVVASACLLIGLTAVGLVAQSSDDKQRVSTLTNNLVCTCGCANIIVASCDCGQAAEMRKEVAAFVQAGKTDAEIYEAFEKKYGPAVLGAPKLQGFNILAWVLPFVGLAAGAVLVIVVVKRLRPSIPEPETAEAKPPEIDEKYRRLLEEELREE